MSATPRQALRGASGGAGACNERRNRPRDGAATSGRTGGLVGGRAPAAARLTRPPEVRVRGSDADRDGDRWGQARGNCGKPAPLVENQLRRDRPSRQADELIVSRAPQLIVKTRVDQGERQVRQVGGLLLEKEAGHRLDHGNLWLGSNHGSSLRGVGRGTEPSRRVVASFIAGSQAFLQGPLAPRFDDGSCDG